MHLVFRTFVHARDVEVRAVGGAARNGVGGLRDRAPFLVETDPDQVPADASLRAEQGYQGVRCRGDCIEASAQASGHRESLLGRGAFSFVGNVLANDLDLVAALRQRENSANAALSGGPLEGINRGEIPNYA